MPSLAQTRTAPVGIGWRHPHYAALMERRPALDFIEVHSENFFGDGGAALAVLESARAHYAVSLHGVGLSLGGVAGIDAWHLQRLHRLVQRIEPRWVSDHASFARGRWHNGTTVHAADLLPLAMRNDALDVLCANVQHVQETLGRPLLVENLSAYLHWNDPQMSEPEFLNQLARRTGCGLLVDVNNVYVNQLNAVRSEVASAAVDADPVALTFVMQQQAQLQAMAWIEAIAPAAVGELHVAGHHDCGDIVIDDHGSRVCEAVWALHHRAVQRFTGAVTLVEWDTDVPDLDVLLDEAERARRNAHEASAAHQPRFEAQRQPAWPRVEATC